MRAITAGVRFWSGWRAECLARTFVTWNQTVSWLTKTTYNAEHAEHAEFLRLARPPPTQDQLARRPRAGCIVLHVVREPYCGDGIAVIPKGTKAWDYETERDVINQVNGIHTLCGEKAGATYVFDKGRFRRVVDSD
jgi:hypothetical protein